MGKALGDNTPKKTPKKRKPRGNLKEPWKPGQSGNPNGRPKSARNKLSEDFISGLAKVYSEMGEDAIRRVAVSEPDKFLTVVGKLVPREDTLTHDGGISFTRIERTFVDPEKTDS